ncbi:MAG TPA: hypothetical protein VGY48_15190 [Vicinamibacterales bacterium]|jgi:hypothetical protein|nr:hypothetical protein [Vicinamibacterales bacterium]
MARETLELESLDGVADADFHKPVRLVFSNPRRGGPRVSTIRAALTPKGKLRLSGTPARIFADLDPGEPEAPLITLDTIVRSDAAGLERMLLTSLEHVDAIVLGIDGRSDEATREVAMAYADVTHVFRASDIDMSAEAWEANKIDFAAARNIGRKLVTTPWTLVIDSDEYVESASDIRARVREADRLIGSFSPAIKTHGADYRDAQRLARSSYLWKSATHNQLQRTAGPKDIDMVIVSDTSLRERAEIVRRDAQRQIGIEEMVDAAAKGDLGALFHVAKHKAAGDDVVETVRLVEDYRGRCTPGDILADDRMWLAMALAFKFYEMDDMGEANRWACRALLDGPSVAAFCVLGDVAEDEGHLDRALQWYQAACSMEETGKIKWPGLTELRFGRLAGIKRALVDPTTAPTIAMVSGD